MNETLEQKEQLIIEEPKKMAYPTVAQGWGIIGLFIIVAIGYAMPMEMVKLALGESAQGPMVFSAYVIPLVILIFITRAWWKKNPLNKGTLKLRPFPLTILPAVIIITYAMLLINVEITSWVPVPEWLMEMFKEFARDDIWGFLTIAVAAPLLEEALMRGIVLDGMLKNYKPWKAIVWSAVLFGVLHLNPWQFVSAFLIGLVMGYLYWKTKSLWLCIIIHAVNNGTAFFLMKSHPDASSWTDMFGLGTVERVGIFFLAILTVFGAYKYFESYFKKQEEQSEEVRYNK